jgi:hypothetical protein
MSPRGNFIEREDRTLAQRTGEGENKEEHALRRRRRLREERAGNVECNEV